VCVCVVQHGVHGAPQLTHNALQVSIVERADSSSVLPCPVSISTKNKMNFLFANLKDRDFLVQRISDFLQRTPGSPPPPVGPSVRRSDRNACWVDLCLN